MGYDQLLNECYIRLKTEHSITALVRYCDACVSAAQTGTVPHYVACMDLVALLFIEGIAEDMPELAEESENRGAGSST